MNSLIFENKILKLVDQTKLPEEYVILECKTYHDVASAIKNMIIRGAPAIGIAGCYGVVIGAFSISTDSKEIFFNKLKEICDFLKNTRPTAVNLFWAIDRIYNKALSVKESSIENIKNIILDEADFMYTEDCENNKLIGIEGSKQIKENSTILTYCNTGALATCGYGTAMSVIKYSYECGKIKQVFTCETRPYLQGSRLTAWELKQYGIPFKLICDNMAGHFMKSKFIDYVIVGADRIARNGDTANKIGTYSLSVLAKENNIPFYVAAPFSTIDFRINSGEDIIIEERDSKEITHIKNVRITPEDIEVMNPSFDVTPSKYIEGFMTNKGFLTPPFS